jgi:hypothetical protein
VFGTYGLAMSYEQEFETSLSMTIGDYRPELGTLSKSGSR